MPSPQPGIFALGTRSHRHLELTVPPDADAAAVRAALRGLREPAVTSGGANLVIGFGPALWDRLAPAADVPEGLADFVTIEGLDGKVAPATQRDVWVWVHGTGEDVVLDVARAVARALAPVATVALDQPCFVHRDGRDLTGFVDGTANPPVTEGPAVACVPDGRPGAGGAFVLAQRWVHDLEAFDALPLDEQERVIGRTKDHSVELDDAHKPPTAHIARAEADLPSGEEAELFRRSTPFGGVGEQGLYFLAFAADPGRFALILERMHGCSGDGIRDRLLDFSRPVTGSYFFAPAADRLDALLDADADADADDADADADADDAG